MESNKYYSVSRIEGDFAVLECPDRHFEEMPLSKLPAGVSEGNILVKSENGEFLLDFDEELRRKNKLLELQNKIFGNL